MSPPRFVHRKISSDDFKAELAKQGMSVSAFARVWCQNLSTVRKWANGGNDIPTWVPIALTMMTLPNAHGTARMAAAAMIQQDRLHPELGEFPYQKLRQMPADDEIEE
ncbi:hypothetical protein AB7M45_007838 [Bradyrhizobium elkanii]|uniref:hypothetical protein n=1 Tax=Bradyrhizobium elkanii TaxID=29448 RepID=UPI00092225BF|nr:hypothetical protein [Bradyrhizobium elkanii]MCW2195065.1 hypothetical protein [Bradyrhizobium elkanii]NWL67242.1 hypothetical protein [Bradyrhizobium elkanii]OIM94093.1 hypothetical protein BLN97_12530 [Bradyrhizobium elkanii]